ncbi:MAG: polyisoprenoid-binding protein [Sphingobacteriia bacterium]|nr:MAG: polyisoprenoid-binding protein [Sphingobacteriia bacterium]
MAQYKIDGMHSEISFKVKHLMITNVTGTFTRFDASMRAEAADYSDAQISFQAEIDSINTNNEQRDGHLKSADFFDAAQFPQMQFVSTGFKPLGGDRYQLAGDLTLKGITKAIVLDAELGGTMTDPYGQFKVGFEISGSINRSDFGLTWSAVTEAGGVVVSEAVKLHLSVQMVKQA